MSFKNTFDIMYRLLLLRIIVFRMSGLDENTILNYVRRYQGVIPWTILSYKFEGIYQLNGGYAESGIIDIQTEWMIYLQA